MSKVIQSHFSSSIRTLNGLSNSITAPSLPSDWSSYFAVCVFFSFFFSNFIFKKTHSWQNSWNSNNKQLAQTHPGGQFTFRRAAFLTQLQSKVDLALTKAVPLRININLDGAPIESKSHTHPSHSQTSRLLTSSLSLGVPVPRPTQCVRDA